MPTGRGRGDNRPFLVDDNLNAYDTGNFGIFCRLWIFGLNRVQRYAVDDAHLGRFAHAATGRNGYLLG